jgi:hypothetical protein
VSSLPLRRRRHAAGLELDGLSVEAQLELAPDQAWPLEALDEVMRRLDAAWAERADGRQAGKPPPPSAKAPPLRRSAREGHLDERRLLSAGLQPTPGAVFPNEGRMPLRGAGDRSLGPQ